jgi:kynurenine formamidase
MSVFNLNGLRVNDLSKHIVPETETRLCNLKQTYGAKNPIPGYGTELTVTSHLGTHVECPTHQHNTWPSVGELPLSNFMGRGIYLSFSDLPPRTVISYEQMEALCGEKVKPGDVLILDSQFKLEPFTKQSNTEVDERLIVGTEAANWCAEHEVKAVGFGDGVSMECPREGTTWQFHEILLAKNITFIEVLKNLDQLTKETFFITFTPMPIVGLDSCCVWVAAIEGIEGF